MKITKFVHSCLLVEMPAPVNRTALFDPGVYSADALNIDALKYLDDIIITHSHPDHFDIETVKKLVQKFPDVRITTTPEAAQQLADENISAVIEDSQGIVFFDSPHESMQPLAPQLTQEIGVHYLDKLTHPGDSHSFNETKSILALPVQAPWSAMITAVNLALRLKPQHIIPIHDWHWHDEARTQQYERLEKFFGDRGITFCKMKNNQPVVLEV